MRVLLRDSRPSNAAGAISFGGLAIAVVAIAVLPLAPLAPLLRFDAEGRHRTRFEPLDADLFPGLEAVSVRAILDALERIVDLANEFALAVAGAQLEAEFLFLRRAVIRVGEVGCLVFHVRDGSIHLDHQVALPGVENVAEVLELLLVHVQLAALDDVGLYIARSREKAPRLDALAFIAFGVQPRRCGADRGGLGRRRRRWYCERCR